MNSLLCLLALILIVGSASASVNCQSIVYGDTISESTDYVRTIENQTACEYSQTGYSSRLISHDGNYQSFLTGDDNQFEHMTSLTMTGTYRGGMFTTQTSGGCDESTCVGEGCGDDSEVTYSQARFAVAGMGDRLNIQTAGSTGATGMTGQAYITGSGLGQISAGSMSMNQINSTFSEQRFEQTIRASGHDITAGMMFSWAR